MVVWHACVADPPSPKGYGATQSGPHGSPVIPARLRCFAGRGGHESCPNPLKPCIRAGLTAFRAVGDPIRDTFALSFWGMNMGVNGGRLFRVSRAIPVRPSHHPRITAALCRTLFSTCRNTSGCDRHKVEEMGRD